MVYCLQYLLVRGSRMFTRLNKKLLLLLALAVMIGPYVHTAIGCDDDASAGLRPSSNLPTISHSTSAKDHHELPGDGCCELDFAVGVLAHSRQLARSAPDSPVSRAPATLPVRLRAGVSDSQSTNFLVATSHPPLVSMPPLFLSLGSLLI